MDNNVFSTFRCTKVARLRTKIDTAAVCRQQHGSSSPTAQQGLSNVVSPCAAEQHPPSSPEAAVKVIPALESSTRSPEQTENHSRKRRRAVSDLPDWSLKALRQAGPLSESPGVPELLGNSPLRLVIVGHNPSEHAWRTGHYYSNPSNHMWRILKTTSIAPATIRGALDDQKMQGAMGVGFVDVGCGHPGTLSANFSSEVFSGWIPMFFQRLRAHMQRASEAAGCYCGMCGAPRLVAIAGKRQWQELMNYKRSSKKITKVDLLQQHERPEDWPLPSSTEVWVMSSTSGASALTTEARLAPWRVLSDRLYSLPWPCTISCPTGMTS